MLKFWSLFSGAGLFDAGFAQAGIKHALFCESDPWRREMLRKRWPGVPVLEDIRKLRAGDAAALDGIVGGFPCKGVSSAGNRNGFDHPETVLWREMARVVGEVRPTYVVLENVANLLTLKKGLVWQEVLETLATLGFDVVWDCIPAAAVGAPHRRDRVFAVAAHSDEPEQRQCGGSREGGRASAGRQGEARKDLRERFGGVADTAAHADGAHAERHAGQRGLADGRPDAGGGAEAPAHAERESLQLRGGAGDLGASPGGGGRAARQQRNRDAVADRAEAAADTGSQRRDRRKGQPREGRDTRLGREAGGDVGNGNPPSAPGVAVDWGEYEPAVRRWEAIHGAAPEPLVSRMDDGDPKLRRVRARVDRSRLSALGDGVHTYVGRLVGEYVVWLDQQARLQQKERAHA
jgi:DNA (cytosine-5)-methyltransferase 1